MRVLVISQTGDFLGVASRLAVEGHRVAMWIKSPDYVRAGRGIVERVDTWRERLRDSDLVVVDMVGLGHIEDTLKRVGVPFIGASRVMDKLELDRAFGMEAFRRLGIKVPESFDFNSPEEARGWFDGEDWGDGWVIKADGNIGCATSRVIKEPEQLDWAFKQYPKSCKLIVQRLIDGVEVSTEGWFNGTKWVEGAFNHTFEEKRFLEGDLGPNTGCMGNVVLARGRTKLVRETVEKVEPLLGQLGWRGPIDVNCIVNEEGAWALEATARFGYDAIEAFLEGIRLPVGDFLREIAEGDLSDLEVWQGPMIAVRLAVPPYPSEDDGIKAEYGEPILGINEDNIRHLWLANMYVEDNLFRTSGGDGLTMKVTARGEDVGQARRRVYRTLDNIRVGSKMYRRDIGQRVNDDVARLRAGGWI